MLCNFQHWRLLRYHRNKHTKEDMHSLFIYKQ